MKSENGQAVVQFALSIIGILCVLIVIFLLVGVIFFPEELRVMLNTDYWFLVGK